MITVAALYVQTGGVYYGIDGVDQWDEKRDARTYDGPHPVVAHPPCARWGRYWSGGPSAKVRRKLGDDGGCFEAAFKALTRWGGVIEHPEASHAWHTFAIAAPPKGGGWIRAMPDGSWWTCCVEQGHYGHRARKATWLLTTHKSPPVLKWGPSASTVRVDQGFHSAEERRAFYANSSGCTGARKSELIDQWEAATGRKHFRRLGKRELSATPITFRDLLLEIARGCRRRT